jgi:hypothetical protein
MPKRIHNVCSTGSRLGSGFPCSLYNLYVKFGYPYLALPRKRVKPLAVCAVSGNVSTVGRCGWIRRNVSYTKILRGPCLSWLVKVALALLRLVLAAWASICQRCAAAWLVEMVPARCAPAGPGRAGVNLPAARGCLARRGCSRSL